MAYNIRMITVNIQGHGTFIIPSDKINELISWLTSNSIKSEALDHDVDSNSTLLNE